MRRWQLPSWLANRLGLATVLIVISVVLIALGQQGRLEPLEGVLQAALAPVQRAVSNVFNAVTNAFNAPADLAALRAENAELQNQITDLTAENVKLQEDAAQLKVVSALLDYARNNPEWKYIAADVIARDESLFLRFVLLNKGSRDGVARDMIVVTDQGLVGVVTEVTATACKVLLITDASSAVNVRVQESRAEGVVTGQQSGELRLNFISVDVDLKTGDRVLTSGLGGQFPSGIIVGTVASVRKRTFDVFQEADVQSAVDFNKLETVLVIADFEQPEVAPLLTTPTPAP
jgi:rod shape-determining protein MreC